MSIIMRGAGNDFDAFRIATAMDGIGVDVFSITFNGMDQPYGAMIPSARFIVWGKMPPGMDTDLVDGAISRELES